MKQNVRNVLTQKPELLPYFFTLTLHDALTFNPVTLDGGPNGSLRLELERPENAALKVAADEIAAIRTLQRQDMSFADTCAFAGAVAVEVTGGPRIVVQLGREDAPDPDVVSGDGSALYTGDATAAQLRQAFEHAGLDGSRDVVLFHGAVGSLNDIGQTRAAKLRESAISDDDDEEEDDDVTSKDDVTYGKVQASGEPGGSRKRRGAVLVETNVSLLTLGGQKKFGNDYLKAMLKAAKDESSSSSSDSKLSKRDRELLNDKEMREMVQRYADNNGRFVNDMADLYQKVSLLGSSFESMTLRD